MSTDTLAWHRATDAAWVAGGYRCAVDRTYGGWHRGRVQLVPDFWAAEPHRLTGPGAGPLPRPSL